MLRFCDQIWLLLFGANQILHAPTQWLEKILFKFESIWEKKKQSFGFNFGLLFFI